MSALSEETGGSVQAAGNNSRRVSGATSAAGRGTRAAKVTESSGRDEDRQNAKVPSGKYSLPRDGDPPRRPRAQN